MAAEKATAYVLRLVEFSETSCIATLFTREFGKIGVLAKGARRLKGPFDSAIDVLACSRIVFLRKSSGNLDLLTEAKLQWRFRPPGRDLAALNAGYYLAELLLALTDEYDPHPKLFDLTDESLQALAAGDAAARVVLRFELVALRLLGHLPNLDNCVECGEPVPRQTRMAFGLLAGGVLCARCRPGKKHVASVTPATLEVMRTFADNGKDAWRNLKIDRANGGELRGVLNQYISHLIGHKPKMHRYLEFSTASGG